VLTISRVAWRLLPEVRPAERRRFLFFFSLCGLVSLASTLGLAAVEALFLVRLGPELLPATFILAAPVTVLGMLAYGSWVARTRNDRFFVQMLLGAALVLCAATAIVNRGPAWIYPALFCFLFLSDTILINHYWTFTGDFFDTLASKRLVPLFNVGNSLGGVTGGLLAVLLSRLLPIESLVAAWALFLVAAAVLLRTSRRALRRWGPLELEEADETSLQGLGVAVRYSRRTPIGRWLVASTAAMILALIVSQYLYLSIFVQAFPSVEALAGFLGIYLAITNAVEVWIAMSLVPRLIRRMGVAAANLVHPVLTAVSFGALALEPGLAAAVAARANREMLENSMAGPLRTLVYNALPLRFRDRIRALLEGIVVYSGMALAGGLLLVAAPRFDASTLAWIGGATALLYLLANWRVRRAYLDTMIRRLREGRLDFAELGEELGKLGDSRLVELWDSLLAAEDARGRSTELQLARVLVVRGMLDAVLRGVAHADSRVRVACISALVGSDEPHVARALEPALRDRDPDVRLAAARAVREIPAPTPELRESMRALEGDPSPAVRAEAAAAANQGGFEILRAMAASSDPDAVVEALRRLPRELLGSALDHTRSDNPTLRAEALEAASRLARPVPIPADHLARDLAHPEIPVRLAALRALATRDERSARQAVAQGLADSSWELRRLAAEILAEAGPDSIEITEPYLHAASPGAAEAAARALAAIGTPEARERLNAELRLRVRDAWKALLAIRVLSSHGGLAERFLRAALDDVVVRGRVLAFRLLELLEDAAIMRTVEKVMRFASARARADALEVLSNLGDREASELLVLMLDEGSVDEKLAEVSAYLSPPRNLEEVLETTRDTSDHWIRAAAAALGSEPIPHPMPEAQMERLLVLREVGLFEHLSLDQLEAINQVLEGETYFAGEEICREGDLGIELYVLVEGEVQFYKNRGASEEILLRTQGPVNYFGEMAILDGAPRSATVVAGTDARLLKLNGERLNELILQTPEIAFELFRVLTQRIRTAEERLGFSLRESPPAER
jgi:HEAT repeat protein